MNTITHCTIFKAFLFCRHLCWGKEETQMGKVKEERKTPLFMVLFYLGNTAQALLLITPDRCYINPGKRNYSITLLLRLRDSQILLYYLYAGVSQYATKQDLWQKGFLKSKVWILVKLLLRSQDLKLSTSFLLTLHITILSYIKWM